MLSPGPEKSKLQPGSHMEHHVASGDRSFVPGQEYPEGGLEGWGVVFGSFCVMMSVFGPINTSAVFESYFLQQQLKNNSSSEIAWIFSLYLFTVYFLGLLAGPIFDRYGHRVLIASGSSFGVASFMLLSFCSGMICR